MALLSSVTVLKTMIPQRKVINHTPLNSMGDLKFMFWNYASCLIQSLIDTQVIHKCYSAMVANNLELLSYFFLDAEIIRINSVKNILCVVHFFKRECISFANSHQFNARPYCIGPLRPISCPHDDARDFVLIKFSTLLVAIGYEPSTQ